MAKRFEGKTALVTGGSRGIGKAIVEGLIKEGATVYALGRSQKSLDKLKEELPSVRLVQADVADWEATGSAVSKIGVVDLLVNNAAMIEPGVTKFVDVEKQLLDDILTTNLSSAFNISQIVARTLISAGKPGSIVNISSTWGRRSQGGQICYSISKAMMEMLTKTMALELGPQKIRVNAVSPTTVLTDMVKEMAKDEEFVRPYLKQHPLGRFAELQDVVNATLFLLSDEASMVTGSSLAVDGGWLVS